MASQVRYAFPAYRVFIFGVEVTSDVTGINVTLHDGSSPNSCQIILLNDEDKYIVTTDDIVAMNPKLKGINIPWLNAKNGGALESDKYSNRLQDLSGEDFAKTVDKTIVNLRKREILQKKATARQAFSTNDREDVDGKPIHTNFTNYYNQNVVNYPVAASLPIFHPMDPVRVFMRDPYDATRWYHHFCGFISDMGDNVDQNNTKTLSIVVEDPTKLFRYTRMVINPGILDAKKVVQDEDLSVQSIGIDPFKGFDLPEIFFTTLFGPDKVGAEKFLQQVRSQLKDTAFPIKIRGVGHFSYDLSGIYTFGPDGLFQATATEDANLNAPEETHLHDNKIDHKLSDLSQWQALIDNEVQPSDMWTMATDEDRANRGHLIKARVDPSVAANVDLDGKLRMEAVITYIGEHPEEYLVDGGKLMMLLPNSLGPTNKNVIWKDIVNASLMETEFTTVGELLYAVIDRIQFVMWCNQKGDMIVEFPMYDFTPSDFGLTTTNFSLKDALPGQNIVPTVLPSTVPVGLDMSSLTAYNESTMAVLEQSDAAGLLDRIRTLRASAAAGFKSTEAGFSDFNDRPRGPFGTGYVITDHDMSNMELGLSDDRVYTIATIPQTLIQFYTTLGGTNLIGPPAVVRRPDLIPLYGARQFTLPLNGYIISPDAAIMYANIRLNQANADAHTASIQILPNLKLTINRPVYITRKNIFATPKKVGHSITWGQSGDMGTSLDVYAVRTWNGTMTKDSEPVFTSIADSKPMDWSLLMGSKPEPTQKPDAQENSLSGTTVSQIQADAVEQAVTSRRGKK